MAFAHNGSVDIYFEGFGPVENPPLLMIGGLGSQATNYPTALCEKFVERGFFVIRFDNRDVGLSTKISHKVPDLAAVMAALEEGEDPVVAYRLADMANDALAVLDALEVDKAHVMGESMGGMIVQQLAIDRPERLLSMTSIMSTTGDPDVGHASPEAMAVLARPLAENRLEFVEMYKEAVRTFGSPGYYDEDDITRAAGEAFDRCNYPVGVARQMTALMASGSRSEALRIVNVPALIMHGDADKLVDISGGRRTAECIPGARFEVLKGMGHDCPPAYWDRWVELIADHAGVCSHG
jgi:pimeloyl-ACP methyl ester carboxylesterase